MFGKKNRRKPADYNKDGKVPVIRASICTGEKVAGFRNIETGRFEDIMLIRGEQDLKDFMELYDVKKEELKKEW